MTDLVHLPDLEGQGRATLFEGEPRTVRLALDAGEEIPPHRHPGREIVCHVLDGRIEMTLGDDVHDLGAGDVARFDGDQDVSPTAVEDSTALLILAERNE